MPVSAVKQAVQTEKLWEAFRDRLRAFVTRRVRHPEDVDDILQEVFLRIHRNLEGLDQRGSLPSWIFQITRNSIVDHYRSRRRKEESLDEGVHQPATPVEEDSLKELRELAQCLSPMIRSLPEAYRDALVMTDLDGATQQEAARRAGVSLSGMKSRIQRARRLLRESLLACCRIEVSRRGEILDYSAYSHQAAPCRGCT